MVEQKIRQTIADVLGLPVEQVTAASSRTNTPEWDSLKHIEVIMAIETEFDRRFSVEQIEKFQTCGEIIKAMQVGA